MHYSTQSILRLHCAPGFPSPKFPANAESVPLFALPAPNLHNPPLRDCPAGRPLLPCSLFPFQPQIGLILKHGLLLAQSLRLSGPNQSAGQEGAQFPITCANAGWPTATEASKQSVFVIHHLTFAFARLIGNWIPLKICTICRQSPIGKETTSARLCHNKAAEMSQVAAAMDYCCC